MSIRRGVTLIELVVVLVLLGVMSAVVVLALPGPAATATNDVNAKLFAAKREALRSGRPVIVWLADSGGTSSALALPDGSVVADLSAHIERFAGRVIPDSMAAK